MKLVTYPVSGELQQETGTQQGAPIRTRTIDRNLPRSDLLGDRNRYLNICVPLYNASMRGDWEAAKSILDQNQDLHLVRSAITQNYDTTLHIAASAKNSKWVDKFVQNLVNKMEPEDLQLKNVNGNTSLCIAAAAGNVKTVMTMLKRNPVLAEIPGSNDMMPLYMATLFGKHDMVNYLYDLSKQMTGDCWNEKLRGWVLVKCVEADLFDIAFKIVSTWPILTKSHDVLKVLARKTDAFSATQPYLIWRIISPILAVIHVKVGPAEKPSDAMKLLRLIWAEILKLPLAEIETIIRGPPEKPTTSGDLKKDALNQVATTLNTIPTTPIKGIDIEAKGGIRKHPSRVLFVAAETGNIKFLVEIIRQYPDLIWKLNDNNKTIFHVAISHRQEGVYNLIHEIGSMKDMMTPIKDDEGNNMLHLVGKCPNQKKLQVVSGVALQMKRELLWFKEVEALIPPSYRERRNNEGLTPHELFSKEHKDLMSAGEKWMKGTASQSMVVAALIATIVFAAAFTLPGGYGQSNGVPMFLHNNSFRVFVVSDAISLAFSSISLIIFLSILTSRYAEHDFLHILPKRLIRGLASLLISIAAMMVTFSVSFFVFYKDNLIWVPILISVVASSPVILYARYQYDLLGDVYNSVYGSKNLFKPKDLQLYYQNPQL